jgi:hypothetical protein
MWQYTDRGAAHTAPMSTRWVPSTPACRPSRGAPAPGLPRPASPSLSTSDTSTDSKEGIEILLPYEDHAVLQESATERPFCWRYPLYIKG